MDLLGFRDWLNNKNEFSKETISDIVSRVKRANNILPWYDDIIYQFMLEQQPEYQEINCSVRSQMKRAVALYFEFFNSEKGNKGAEIINMPKFKVLSLFANIGVAEAYFQDIDVQVAVANEMIERRAQLYEQIYPSTKMICGDINDPGIYNQIIASSRNAGVDIIMATPPCQGMSTAGQLIEDDERNKLISPVIDAINDLQPKYVFLENVPNFFNTYIDVDGHRVLIPDLLDDKLGENYILHRYIIDTKDYSVPQTRERAITLMTRKYGNIKEWILPEKEPSVVTMEDAIGNLPELDPFVTDISHEELVTMFPHYEERKERAESISKWHTPPHHLKRQVVAMQHTPTGCTAFDNTLYFPKKENGDAVKGYHNTYKRQNWNTAAYTVTMDNRKISSQNNVHPGRLEYVNKSGEPIYSDARVLTLYELMIIMSLPPDWGVPLSTPEAFLRRIIGEGIPPRFVKKVFEIL